MKSRRLSGMLISAALSLVMTVTWAYDPLPALPLAPPMPEDNPLTEAKVTLGKQLYFDARLSFNNKISCNSCHTLPSGVDARPLSVGALGKPARRSTPTVLNAAFQSVQFWDGRAASLEAAVQEHLTDATIMALPDEKALVDRLSAVADYQARFVQAFAAENSISYDTIAQALASYLRTLITPNSPFDRYKNGDEAALSPQARRGLQTFQSVGCSACHFGDNFSGPPVPMGEGFYELFPNYLGSVYDQKYHLVTDDQGRYEVTQDPIHKRLFRMPSLRNVALTAPYFHTGSVATLEEAVRVMAKTQLDKDLSDKQVQDISAFLHALSGELPDETPPDLP